MAEFTQMNSAALSAALLDTNGAIGAGGMCTFNVQDGYPEALVRGYRSGFLTDEDYQHLQQCETLEDVKLNLKETDYGQFLDNEPSPIVVGTIREKCFEKLLTEFTFLRGQATQPLAQFLDCITYEYMIDNVMLVLKATLNNPNVDVQDLMQQCHPLGRFKASTLRSICAFENTPKGYADLYATVLIDTPIGPYFSQFLKEEADKEAADAAMARDAKRGGADMGGVRNLLEEMPTTKLENALRKLHLEKFHRFCEQVGGGTAEVMGELLRARADATAINITLNSFGTTLNEPNMRQSDRRALYPSIGYLYPQGTDRLSHVGDENELGQALKPYPAYRKIWEQYSGGAMTIDDAFYAREVMLNELAFEQQSTYAPFYAYVRLKEQEIRNIVWICECIVQRQKSKMVSHQIPVFSRNAPWRPQGA